MAELRRWPPCQCMVCVPYKGRVTSEQLGGVEFTGRWSGRSVAVLDGDEGPARDGAGGGGGGGGRGAQFNRLWPSVDGLSCIEAQS